MSYLSRFYRKKKRKENLFLDDKLMGSSFPHKRKEVGWVLDMREVELDVRVENVSPGFGVCELQELARQGC